MVEPLSANPQAKKDSAGCWRISCIALVVLPLICALGGYLSLRPRPILNGLSGDEREVIEQPDKVEIVRIEPFQAAYQKIKSDDVLRQVKPMLPPAVASPALRDELVRAFQNARHSFLTNPKCDPQPGVLFRFTRGGKTVDSAYCAMCGAVYIYHWKVSYPHMTFVDPEPFTRVALKAFPKDEALARGDG